MDRLTEEPMSEEDLKTMLDGMGADRKEKTMKEKKKINPEEDWTEDFLDVITSTVQKLHDANVKKC